MSRGAREDGLGHRQARRREGLQHGGSPLGVLAQREGLWRSPRHREEPMTAGIAGPPAQGDPPAGRCDADHRERADANAHERRRQVEQRPERERQPDRGGGVQPPPQDLAGHHQRAGAAALALVATRPDRRDRGGAVRRGRAPDLALACPVAVHHEISALGAARGAAPRAPPGTNGRHRGHLRQPGLDAERAPANSIAAPHLTCSELDAKGSAKIDLRVALLWAADMTNAPPPGALLRHLGRARYPPPSTIGIAPLRDPHHRPARAKLRRDRSGRGGVNTAPLPRASSRWCRKAMM